MQVQAFVAERPVERLNVGIVRRLAWPREVDPDAVVVGPEVDEPAGELTAIAHWEEPVREPLWQVMAGQQVSKVRCRDNTLEADRP